MITRAVSVANKVGGSFHLGAFSLGLVINGPNHDAFIHRKGRNGIEGRIDRSCLLEFLFLQAGTDVVPGGIEIRIGSRIRQVQRLFVEGRGFGRDGTIQRIIDFSTRMGASVENFQVKPLLIEAGLLRENNAAVFRFGIRSSFQQLSFLRFHTVFFKRKTKEERKEKSG